jgi:hypothetical protein
MFHHLGIGQRRFYWMASFGNYLTRERSFDQNVIHEYILQIEIA